MVKSVEFDQHQGCFMKWTFFWVSTSSFLTESRNGCWLLLKPVGLWPESDVYWCSQWREPISNVWVFSATQRKFTKSWAGIQLNPLSGGVPERWGGFRALAPTVNPPLRPSQEGMRYRHSHKDCICDLWLWIFLQILLLQLKSANSSLNFTQNSFNLS